MRSTPSWLFQSSVQQTHDPADPEQRQHEAAEAVQAVMYSRAVRSLGNQAEHHARKEREEERKLKMIEAEGHVGF